VALNDRRLVPSCGVRIALEGAGVVDVDASPSPPRAGRVATGVLSTMLSRQLSSRKFQVSCREFDLL
jgi:hypothetical protein